MDQTQDLLDFLVAMFWEEYTTFLQSDTAATISFAARFCLPTI